MVIVDVSEKSEGSCTPQVSDAASHRRCRLKLEAASQRRLYGRQRHVDQVRTWYEQCSVDHGTSCSTVVESTTKTRARLQLVIVHGPAGVGKRALARSSIQPMVQASRGWFVSGTCLAPVVVSSNVHGEKTMAAHQHPLQHSALYQVVGDLVNGMHHGTNWSPIRRASAIFEVPRTRSGKLSSGCVVVRKQACWRKPRRCNLIVIAAP
jgi:hypothetical protein